uniref:Uncharacterized protein n=1 Tax=Arundo donax TaxID=35708 RepID=A0A0A9EZW9_ARUDO
MLVLLLFLYPVGATPEAISYGSQLMPDQICIKSQ